MLNHKQSHYTHFAHTVFHYTLREGATLHVIKMAGQLKSVSNRAKYLACFPK